jgi:hypothetical protein
MHNVHLGFSFSFIVFVSSLPKRPHLASHWILGCLFNLAVHWLFFYKHRNPANHWPTVSLCPPEFPFPSSKQPKTICHLLPAEMPPRTTHLLAIVPYKWSIKSAGTVTRTSLRAQRWRHWASWARWSGRGRRTGRSQRYSEHRGGDSRDFERSSMAAAAALAWGHKP